MRVGIDRATVKRHRRDGDRAGRRPHVDGAALARAAKPRRAQAVRRGGDPARVGLRVPLGPAVEAIQGAQVVPGTAQLAPSKLRARAARAASGRPPPSRSSARTGKVGVGDDIGQWGLEARYQDQLAGTPARRIVIRDRSGAPIARCCAAPAARGASCETTLDRDVQQAAEDGARRQQGEVGAGRRAALDGRHPRRRQPPDRCHLRPRDRRPLPARLDVQGHHHRGAAARRAQDERHGRLPEDDHRRRQAVQELRGRGGGRGALRHATSRSRATRPSCRSPRGWRPTRCRARRATSASGARAPARCPPAATRWRARRR